MTSNAAQPTTARVLTPQSKSDPSDVKVEEIPMPPVEMWGTLDNSGDKPASVPEKAPAAVREIAQLDFAVPTATMCALDFPFSHPDLGYVKEIKVQRLTVGAVGTILDERAADAPDMFDIYERMTGIPAPVLRGLIDVDGERVTGACFDFLPRLLRPVAPPK